LVVKEEEEVFPVLYVSLRDKRRGREVDNSSTFCTDVENGGVLDLLHVDLHMKFMDHSDFIESCIKK
jgi:hypothetical protein